VQICEVIGSEAKDQHGIPAGSIVISYEQVQQHHNTMDITPIFNQVLVKHHARPVEPYVFRVEALEDFVKEAYRIVGHVAPQVPK
jgi:hypothetical protein